MTPTKSSHDSKLSVWFIVLCCATIAGVGMGLRQVMGFYQAPLTSELGLGRAAFSLAIAIANIVWGFAAPFAGGIADKYGAGRVVAFGALCTAVGLAMMGIAKSEAILYVSGVFMGLGVAGAGVNSMVGAVGRAAGPERRTAAIATLGMGSGLGVLAAVPFNQVLIDNLGWQWALFALAITAISLIPLAWVVRGRPQDQVGAAKQSLGEALREAIKTPSYLLLLLGFFVCGFHVVFYGQHLPAYVQDKGLSPRVAVEAMILVGIGNLIGTYLAGQSARFFPKQYGLSFIYFARSVVFLGFLYLPITETTILLLSAVLGLLWLSTIPLTSSLVGTFFGPAWMTMLYGVVFLSHQVGSALGVWLGGQVFDTTHSYDIMWWICVALGVIAGLLHLPIRDRPVVRAATPQPVPTVAE